MPADRSHTEALAPDASRTRRTADAPASVDRQRLLDRATSNPTVPRTASDIVIPRVLSSGHRASRSLSGCRARARASQDASQRRAVRRDASSCRRPATGQAGQPRCRSRPSRRARCRSASVRDRVAVEQKASLGNCLCKVAELPLVEGKLITTPRPFPASMAAQPCSGRRAQRQQKARSPRRAARKLATWPGAAL